MMEIYIITSKKDGLLSINIVAPLTRERERERERERVRTGVNLFYDFFFYNES